MNESEFSVDILDEIHQESITGRIFARVLLSEMPGAISTKEYHEYIKHVQSEKLKMLIQKKHINKIHQPPTADDILGIALLSVFHRVMRYFKDINSIQKHFSNIKSHAVVGCFSEYLSGLIPKNAQEEFVINVCKSTISQPLSFDAIFDLETRLAVVM